METSNLHDEAANLAKEKQLKDSIIAIQYLRMLSDADDVLIALQFPEARSGVMLAVGNNDVAIWPEKDMLLNCFKEACKAAIDKHQHKISQLKK